jgi:thiosulfate/3-mercaptopyruvate sulfurtransferase
MSEPLLVESDRLAASLRDPRRRIVDIRGIIKPPEAPTPWYLAGRDAYLAAHIPGAVFVDWTEDILRVGAGPRQPGRDGPVSLRP